MPDHPMRRFLVLCALAACASPQTSGTDEITPRQATVLTDDRVIKADAPRAVSLEIAAPPTSVWTIVKRVYQSLDIPVTVENTKTRQIGNNDFFKSRTMAGLPMSHFVNCGTGMTGSKADSYRIHMSALTIVAPNGQGGTRLETTFVPIGQDVTGGSADRIACGTTGNFEALINENVRDNVKP